MMTETDDRSVPLRRLKIDRAVSNVDGQPLPDDDAFDEHIIGLLDEAERIIPAITFERQNNGEAGRIHYLATGPKVTYDPSANLGSGAADAKPFRTVALLHEIMHVTCDRQYVKPAWAAANLYGRNFHVPATLTTDDEVGQSLRAQQDIIDANYQRAAGMLSRDSSKVIDKRMRAYLNERFGYGQGMPDVHYDTVLFELLVYMAMKKAQDTPTFRYLEKLSVEAAERRTERPPRAAVDVGV
jgi:hypothetical protein